MDNNLAAVFTIMPIFVIVISAAIFTFAILNLVSPRFRGWMMGRSIKATKFMIHDTKEDIKDIAKTGSDIYFEAGKDILDSHKDDLKGLAKTAAGVFVDTGKEVLDEHGSQLKDMNERMADIAAPGIKGAVRAVKEGLTEDPEKAPAVYCKHCGQPIDADSQYCSHCGKAQ